MHRALIVSVSLLVASGSAVADDAAAPRTAAVVGAKKPARTAGAQPTGNRSDARSAKGDVQMSGMSILGNQEAPKSLGIVPWKSSELGDTPSLSKLLDDSTQPVDKEVFMRELAYYEIKTDSK